MTYRASAHGNGNTNTALVTVPATCQAGDVLVVHLALNNTGTPSTPTGLTLADTNTVTANFPNFLYTAVVGSGAITAGGTLSFPIGAVRTWTLTLYAASGLDTANPIAGYNTSAAITTTAVMPSLSLSGSGATLLEIAAVKSNPGPVTSLTAPAGFTSREQCPAWQTYAGATIIAEGNSTVGSGTYGGQTYTANTAFNCVVLYTIGLAALPVKSGSASASLSLSSSAAGSTVRSGSATAGLSLASFAAGVSNRSGSASGSLVLTSSASSIKHPAGSAALDLALTSDAVGSAPAVDTHSGSAALDLVLTASAVGSSRRRGSASATLHLSSVALGSTQRRGLATSTLILSTAAVGTTERVGQAHLDLVLVGTAAGRSRDPKNITVTAKLVGSRYASSIQSHSKTSQIRKRWSAWLRNL